MLAANVMRNVKTDEICDTLLTFIIGGNPIVEPMRADDMVLLSNSRMGLKKMFA